MAEKNGEKILHSTAAARLRASKSIFPRKLLLIASIIYY